MGGYLPLKAKIYDGVLISVPQFPHHDFSLQSSNADISGVLEQ